MTSLFDNSQGYTAFTNLGSNTIINIQKFLKSTVSDLQNKNVDNEEIVTLLKKFLSEEAFNTLKEYLGVH